MPRWLLPLGFLTILSAGCGDPVCGNTEVEDGEQCDDGNQVAGDGCEVTCLETPVTCGNGVIDAGELCFDTAQTIAVGAFPNAVVVGNLGLAPNIGSGKALAYGAAPRSRSGGEW